MIKIVLADGSIVNWAEEEYTDYKYDGKCFIIIRDEEWVAFYNMDFVISITVLQNAG